MSGSLQRKHIRVIIGCIGIYAAGMSLYVWHSVNSERQEILRDQDQRLLQAATSVKYLLPPDFHDRALGGQSLTQAEAARLRTPLTHYANECGLKCVYTIIEKNGRLDFGLSPASAIGMAHGAPEASPADDAIPAAFVKAWRENRTAFADTTDRWGPLRSVALPQITPGGRRYLACVDVDIGEVHKLLRTRLFTALATSLFFVLLMYPFILAYRSFLRTRHLELLAINTELIDFQTHLGDLVTARTADLMEAKDTAEEANRVKSRFLFNLSHEIRTPMNGIISYGEAILNTTSLVQAQHFAQIVLQESDILHRMIGDLLDHAKLEEGKLELDPQPICLPELTDNITSTFHMLARKKGLNYECRLEPGAPEYVRADFLRLRQVLLNLISNAIKFTEKGAVTVNITPLQTEGEHARLRFTVQDTGIGIPREKHKTIFESFSQADLSTTRKFGGTGLGMPIAQQLVRLMGGEIQLESEPGHGSTFWFEAEFAKATRAEARKFLDTPNGSRDIQVECVGKLLVAEDYPTNQDVIRLFLEEAGHQVTIVNNGKEALAACAREPFDLVLMDIQMPEMDGYEAAYRIRHGGGPNARIPIIALTASAETSSRLECKQMGMNDIVLKPVYPERLLEVLARWLRTGASQKKSATPPETGSESSETPLQWDVAVREFGSEDVVLRVADKFMLNLGNQLSAMQCALESGDLARLLREAHTLKGGAGSLEAAPLAAVVKDFEQAVKDEQSCDCLAAAFSGIVAEAARLQVFLDDIRAG